MTLRGLTAGWAALGIVLAGATQLRPEAAPVGPGELLLAVWMLFVGFLLLRGAPFTSGDLFKTFLVYWLISVALLGFGALVALSTSRFNSEAVLRDAFAFFFVASLTCLMSLRLLDDSYGSYHLQLARFAFFILTICITLLLVVAMVLPSLGPINFWWAYRFRGWAVNPNQIALFVVGAPFLGWYLLRRSRRLWHRVACGLAIACCVWVGWATYSDGLRVTWALTLGGLATVAWYRAVFRARGTVMYLSHLVMPILVAALAITLGDDLVERVLKISHDIYHGDGGQGDVRTTLWRHGIEVIGHSPLVGFGPGSHSGIYGPFGGNEAHNAFIDWGMSTGALGVLLQLGLLVWIGWRALRSNSLAILGLVAALTIFSMFAYTLRHPLYWLMLVLALAFVEQRERAAVRAPAPAPLIPPRARAAATGRLGGGFARRT